MTARRLAYTAPLAIAILALVLYATSGEVPGRIAAIAVACVIAVVLAALLVAGLVREERRRD